MLDLSRQAALVRGNPEAVSLCIIGAGGIGSNAVYLAASLGITKITVYDPDILKPENVAPGWFSLTHVGLPKVEALRRQALEFTGIEVEAWPVKYTRQPGDFDIVLIGTDTLSSRRAAFKHHNLSTHWWIDARMGRQLCSVYAVDETCSTRYEKELQGKNGRLPCGEKATAYITKGHLMGMIGDVLARIINLEDVPYCQLWDSSMCWRETEWSK